MKTNKIDNIKITKLEKSRVEIIGSVPTEFFTSFRKKALQNINDEVNIDGFRKGKVPENILIAKIGDMTVLEEMAELALSDVYPEIIVNEKIEAIGHPEISITKIAKDNPLEFKIITTVIPEIKIGDYKKIAIAKMKDVEEKFEVTEKEIDAAILKIRRAKVDHSSHDHSKITPEEHDKLIDESLPEVDLEFVTSLGDFKDVNDFKEKVKETLIEEKKSKSKEKKRIAISDAIVEASTIDIPELLIESETKRIEAQFSDDIARMGVSVEDYLKHAKKTIEEIRTEWRPFAERKAKLQLIINKISDVEKVTASKEEIEEEVNHITEHYKDADREMAYTYSETILTNEKVYQFLEGLK